MEELYFLMWFYHLEKSILAFIFIKSIYNKKINIHIWKTFIKNLSINYKYVEI